MEPTYRQHKLLELIKENGGRMHVWEHEHLELHWELTREGYLKSLMDNIGWTFVLTEQAENYFKQLEAKDK